NELAFQVLVKPAGAPYWTYALDNVEVGSNPGAQAPGTDVQLTELFPVDQNFNIAGTPSFEDFVNGVNPTYQFAPIFLTDTMVLPVRASKLGLATGNSAIDYQVQVYSNTSGALLDETPVLSWDPGVPAFAAHQDLAYGAFHTAAPFQKDLPGSTVSIAYNLSQDNRNAVGGMLLLHMNNAFGQRAERAAAAIAQQLIATTYVSAGVNCANGGVAIQHGYDDNSNGVLDTAEITDTRYACNGAVGPQGPAGISELVQTSAVAAGPNCPSGGLRVEIGFDA